MRRTYNASRICPAVIEAIIARGFGCCEMGNDRVSGTVETGRGACQGPAIAKNRPKTYKRVMRPRRRRATQPRLTSPRSVNIVPESLRTSRRGSGRWRSSSGSGLSMFQLEGSADNENYGRRQGAASVAVAVGECSVPCRLAILLTHHTESRPERKVSITHRENAEEDVEASGARKR